MTGVNMYVTGIPPLGSNGTGVGFRLSTSSYRHAQRDVRSELPEGTIPGYLNGDNTCGCSRKGLRRRFSTEGAHGTQRLGFERDEDACFQLALERGFSVPRRWRACPAMARGCTAQGELGLRSFADTHGGWR